MNAAEARRIAQENSSNEVILSQDTPENLPSPEELLPLAWEETVEHIKARIEEGKTSAFLQPLVNIPGKLHKGDRADEVMRLLVQRLVREGYQNIDWDRRDGWVVLRFDW